LVIVTLCVGLAVPTAIAGKERARALGSAVGASGVIVIDGTAVVAAWIETLLEADSA
jgi:hypothetical protein